MDLFPNPPGGNHMGEGDMDRAAPAPVLAPASAPIVLHEGVDVSACLPENLNISNAPYQTALLFSSHVIDM